LVDSHRELVDPEQHAITMDEQANDALPILDNRFKDRFRLIHFKKHRQWFLLNVKDPESLRSALSTLAAYARCERLETVGAEDIQPIATAARSPLRAVREMAVDMLTLMAQGIPYAREALLKLLFHSVAGIRFTAISRVPLWDVDLPIAFLQEFLRTALKDRSAKNREFADSQSRARLLLLRQYTFSAV
jgi:hypothetical protein